MGHKPSRENTIESVTGPPARCANGGGVEIVKKWPWNMILVNIASTLIFLGIAPWGYLWWWVNTHDPEPLTEPLSLIRGEYVSAIFVTNIDTTYKIYLEWPQIPSNKFTLDLNWSIIDVNGNVVQQGRIHQPAGYPVNEVTLGSYNPRPGLRQKIVVKVNEDVLGDGSKSKLTVGNPEINVKIYEGYVPLLFVWTVFTVGPGLVLFVGLLAKRLLCQKSD